MFKIIYKEKGISSFKAINKFKKENNIKKIGHTGTLDPLAQGLLLVAIDDCTKLIPYIANKDKEYVVKLKLGFSSKTYDSEGPISFVSEYQPSLDELKNTINSFIGNIEQIPPIFSSKKIGGKKAYDLARQNKEVKLNPINVTIYSIKNIEYQYPNVSFKAHVSNGTYIRSLVDDIGKKLKCGAYMIFLERTMVNGLTGKEIIDLEKLLNMNSIKINSKKELSDWFSGKNKKCSNLNGCYLLKFSNTIVGVIEVENSFIKKMNLFGNTIEKILKD